MAVDKTKFKQKLTTYELKQLEEIENYWHENKIPNLNEAIRRLLQKGLQKAREEKEANTINLEEGHYDDSEQRTWT